MHPPNNAVALTELRSDTSMFSAGMNLCLTQERRQTSKAVLWPKLVGLEFHELVKQTILINVLTMNRGFSVKIFTLQVYFLYFTAQKRMKFLHIVLVAGRKKSLL